MKTSRGGTDPPLLIYFPGGTAQRLPPHRVFAYRQSSASGKRSRGYSGHPRAKGFPKSIAFDEAKTRNGQPSPAGGRRYAPARTDPPQRSFLLNRARPVFFSARSKRKWGAHCLGQRRIPRARIGVHCRRQPGIPPFDETDRKGAPASRPGPFSKEILISSHAAPSCASHDPESTSASAGSWA